VKWNEEVCPIASEILMPHFGNRECFENCLEDKAE
jgi:hypothetical protein